MPSDSEVSKKLDVLALEMKDVKSKSKLAELDLEKRVIELEGELSSIKEGLKSFENLGGPQAIGDLSELKATITNIEDVSLIDKLEIMQDRDVMFESKDELNNLKQKLDLLADAVKVLGQKPSQGQSLSQSGYQLTAAQSFTGQKQTVLGKDSEAILENIQELKSRLDVFEKQDVTKNVSKYASELTVGLADLREKFGVLISNVRSEIDVHDRKLDQITGEVAKVADFEKKIAIVAKELIDLKDLSRKMEELVRTSRLAIQKIDAKADAVTVETNKRVDDILQDAGKQEARVSALAVTVESFIAKSKEQLEVMREVREKVSGASALGADLKTLSGKLGTLEERFSKGFDGIRGSIDENRLKIEKQSSEMREMNDRFRSVEKVLGTKEIDRFVNKYSDLMALEGSLDRRFLSEIRVLAEGVDKLKASFSAFRGSTTKKIEEMSDIQEKLKIISDNVSKVEASLIALRTTVKKEDIKSAMDERNKKTEERFKRIESGLYPKMQTIDESLSALKTAAKSEDLKNVRGMIDEKDRKADERFKRIESDLYPKMQTIDESLSALKTAAKSEDLKNVRGMIDEKDRKADERFKRIESDLYPKMQKAIEEELSDVVANMKETNKSVLSRLSVLEGKAGSMPDERKAFKDLEEKILVLEKELKSDLKAKEGKAVREPEKPAVDAEKLKSEIKSALKKEIISEVAEVQKREIGERIKLMNEKLGSLSSLSSRLAARTESAASEASRSSVESSIPDYENIIENRIKQIKSEVEKNTLETKQALHEKLSLAAGDAKALRSVLPEFKEKFDAIESRLDEIERTVGKEEIDTTGVEEALSQISKKMLELDGKMKLAAPVLSPKDTKDKEAIIQKGLWDLSAEVNRLSGKVAGIESSSKEVSMIRGSMPELRKKLDALDSSVGSIEHVLGKSAADFQLFGDKIRILERENSRLKDEIAELRIAMRAMVDKRDAEDETSPIIVE